MSLPMINIFVKQNTLFKFASLFRNISSIKNFNVKFSGNKSIHRSYSNENKSISKSSERAEISSHVRETTYEKIKDGSKTVYYTGIIVVGVGALGVILYTIFKELFSSNSPNSVYSRLLSQCSNDPQVQNVLGDQIKGFGEESRRGHRNRLAHQLVIKDGVKHMLMSFHIQGVRKRGTVKADLIEDERGNLITRLLYIEIDGAFQPLILENNTGTGTGPTPNKNNSILEEITY